MSNPYTEQYKDPRWQRKKYEIMEKRGWTCEWCGGVDRTLNVHHKYYERDRAVWAYSDDSYLCLCEDCHKQTHVLKDRIRKEIGDIHPKYLGQYIRSIQRFKEAVAVGEVAAEQRA